MVFFPLSRAGRPSSTHLLVTDANNRIYINRINIKYIRDAHIFDEPDSFRPERWDNVLVEPAALRLIPLRRWSARLHRPISL